LKVKESIKDGRISFFFLVLLVFVLPLSREVFVITLWPWILFRLLESLLSRRFAGKLLQKDNLTLHFLPALFVLLSISMLWTTNIDAGSGHLGRSLLMVLMPLFLGTDTRITQNPARVRTLLKSYVMGATATLLFLWIYAIIYSLSLEGGRIVFDPLVRNWEHAFFYEGFSFLIQPTYFGILILMAAAICLGEIRPGNLFARSPFWPAVLAVLFIGSLFFISSRAMIIAGIFIVLYFMLVKISNKRLVAISMIAALLIMFSMASLHPRFSHFRDLLTVERGLLSYDRLRESTDRGKTWETSYLLIREHPVLGVGIGDVKDEMINKYNELDYFEDSERYLNCHNQFLESWLAGGLAVVILLVLMLFYPLAMKKIQGRFLYGSFLIICLTAFLFESVLNRLWGVAFFSVFYLLLSARIPVSPAGDPD
jgi:O-antigen ligase